MVLCHDIHTSVFFGNVSALLGLLACCKHVFSPCIQPPLPCCGVFCLSVTKCLNDGAMAHCGSWSGQTKINQFQPEGLQLMIKYYVVWPDVCMWQAFALEGIQSHQHQLQWLTFIKSYRLKSSISRTTHIWPLSVKDSKNVT